MTAPAELAQAIALHKAGRLTEAAQAALRAVSMAGADSSAYVILARILEAAGWHQRALNAYRQAITLGQDAAELDEAILRCATAAADWREIPGCGHLMPSSPFLALSRTGSPAILHGIAAARSQKLARRARPLPQRLAGPEGRIRLAYLCGCIFDHPVPQLLAGILERHDRRRFEVTVYCITGQPDESDRLRIRWKAASDRFIPLWGQSPDEIAQRIHHDAIDILVDLDGHTGRLSLAAMARRPAPIQVNFLGFPGTSGADYIDYIIADKIVAPRSEQAWFSEQIVHLPDSVQPNDPIGHIGARPARTACGLPESGFVYGCFNKAYKIGPEIFDIWMRLLLAVPESVLWLYTSDPAVPGNLKREAAARGVAPGRLIFASYAPSHADHLARLGNADLMLDTLPYNAHTTASDALRAGVPVLTCAGTSYIGRISASLLHAIGLPELIAPSLPDYEAMARDLALNPPRLAALRTRLDDNRRTAPLFDPDRYAGALDQAFERMAQGWRSGANPLGFDVERAEKR